MSEPVIMDQDGNILCKVKDFDHVVEVLRAQEKYNQQTNNTFNRQRQSYYDSLRQAANANRQHPPGWPY